MSLTLYIVPPLPSAKRPSKSLQGSRGWHQTSTKPLRAPIHPESLASPWPMAGEAAKAYGQAEALLRDEQFEASAAAAQKAVQGFEALGAEGAASKKGRYWYII